MNATAITGTTVSAYSACLDSTNAAQMSLYDTNMASYEAMYATHWDWAYSYNKWVYFIMSILNLMLLIGAFFIPMRIASLCCLCCVGIAHLVGLIMTGIYVFRQAGKICMANTQEMTISQTGETFRFSDDGTRLKNIWISQIVLSFVLGCCQNIGMR